MMEAFKSKKSQRYLSEYLIDFQGNFQLNLLKEAYLFKGRSVVPSDTFTLWLCSLFDNYISFQKKNFKQFLIPALRILDLYIRVKKSHCCTALVTVRFPETRNANIMKCKIKVLKHHFQCLFLTWNYRYMKHYRRASLIL